MMRLDDDDEHDDNEHGAIVMARRRAAAAATDAERFMGYLYVQFKINQLIAESNAERQRSPSIRLGR